MFAYAKIPWYNITQMVQVTYEELKKIHKIGLGSAELWK